MPFYPLKIPKSGIEKWPFISTLSHLVLKHLYFKAAGMREKGTYSLSLSLSFQNWSLTHFCHCPYGLLSYMQLKHVFTRRGANQGIKKSTAWMLGRHMESTHLSNSMHFALGSSIPGIQNVSLNPFSLPFTGVMCWALAPLRNWVTMFICVARHLWSSGTRKLSCRTLSRFVVCDAFFFLAFFPSGVPQTRSDKVCR